MAINRNSVELSNSRILDDSIFSGAEGSSGSGSYVSPEMIKASAQLTQSLIEKSNNPSKQELKAACGKKPICLFGGKCGDKKKDYKRCVENYSKSKSVKETPVYIPTYTQKADTSDKKFLGMPIGTGITVTVIATAALGFGVYKIIQMLKK